MTEIKQDIQLVDEKRKEYSSIFAVEQLITDGPQAGSWITFEDYPEGTALEEVQRRFAYICKVLDQLTWRIVETVKVKTKVTRSLMSFDGAESAKMLEEAS